jgi:hypothetical protein
MICANIVEVDASSVVDVVRTVELITRINILHYRTSQIKKCLHNEVVMIRAVVVGEDATAMDDIVRTVEVITENKDIQPSDINNKKCLHDVVVLIDNVGIVDIILAKHITNIV